MTPRHFPLGDPDAGKPRLRLLGDFHRTQRKGAILIVEDRKADALRRDDAVSLAKASELVQAKKAEWIGAPPQEGTES